MSQCIREISQRLYLKWVVFGFRFDFNYTTTQFNWLCRNPIILQQLTRHSKSENMAIIKRIILFQFLIEYLIDFSWCTASLASAKRFELVIVFLRPRTANLLIRVYPL